jgi:hypothetical protein
MMVNHPLVKALTIDRTLWLIYYNTTLHLETFKYGMTNVVYPLIWALGEDNAKFHNKPNDVSKGLFRAFVNGCVQMFN